MDDDNTNIKMVISGDNLVFCNELTDMDYDLDKTAMCNFNRLSAKPNLTGLPSGMYILSVLNDEEVIGVEKIIHQQ